MFPKLFIYSYRSRTLQRYVAGGYAFQVSRGIARREVSLLGIEVAYQVKITVAVHIRGCIARRQALLVAGFTERQRT